MVPMMFRHCWPQPADVGATGDNGHNAADTGSALAIGTAVDSAGM